MDPKDRLIVALDVDSEEKAIQLVDKLKTAVRFFKVGLELFSSRGPSIVKELKDRGCEIFLDLKLHDIPTTVSKTAASLTRLGVYMFNVHSLGGYEMMKSSAEAVRIEAERLKMERPKVLGVTILTSMGENELNKIGINDSIKAQVLRLAGMAKEAGLDGVVASPEEVQEIRKRIGKGFLIVTPAVRPAWAGSNDQKRVATPKTAIEAGSDFIVIGRPITEAKDPLSAAKKILEEIKL